MKTPTNPVLLRTARQLTAAEIRHDAEEYQRALDFAGRPVAPANTPASEPGQHEPGAKLDSGKPRVDLVLGDFANALLAVSRVGTHGAEKYTDRGWLSVPNAQERYASAMLRHWMATHSEGVIDPESGLPHLAHAAWNALALCELHYRERYAADDIQILCNPKVQGDLK